MGSVMAVDLGSANTLVYVPGRGIVLDEPSLVAVDERTGELLAFGADAWRVVGSTPGYIQALRPMRRRVAGDPEICKKMLQYFIDRVGPLGLGDRQRTVICVPSDLTYQEKTALREAGEQASAKKTPYLLEAPIAAAIGAGMPVRQPVGNLVVDIGRGATEVAVIALGGIVTSQSVRIAGDDLDQAIQSYIRNKHGLVLGERTAEEIKIKLGSACSLQSELYAEVRGRDLITGLPKTIVTSTDEIRLAIEEPVSAIVDAVKVTLDKTPPELAADIMEQGIVLTGGGALLNGLDVRLHAETGMPIIIAENPLHSVVIGGGQCLEEFEVLKDVLLSSTIQ